MLEPSDVSAENYALQLRAGMTPRAAGATEAEQVESFRRAMLHQDGVRERAKSVLRRNGVRRRFWLPYLNFALQIDRACRRLSPGPSRELELGRLRRMAACGRLDPGLLAAIEQAAAGTQHRPPGAGPAASQ
jgi:hypothetical protein